MFVGLGSVTPPGVDGGEVAIPGGVGVERPTITGVDVGRSGVRVGVGGTVVAVGIGVGLGGTVVAVGIGVGLGGTVVGVSLEVGVGAIWPSGAAYAG